MTAAAIAWLPRVFSPELLIFCLLALQYSPTDSDSDVEVTQQPPFRTQPKGEALELECSVNQNNYYFYWYRQLPGQMELLSLGNFNSFENDLKEPAQELKARLSGERKGRFSYLKLADLQSNDVGLYLCSVKDTVLPTGTDADPDCENGRYSPSALLLGPTCHTKSTTLVCLAQGFFYEWPLDVSWKRDGQEVPRLAVATEKAKAQGKCKFDIASRLRVVAEEWRKGHTYSCHVSQGNVTVEAKYTHQWRPQQSSGLSDAGQSLLIGQLVFLLLAVKSFAYGTILGIYTVYRKKNL